MAAREDRKAECGMCVHPPGPVTTPAVGPVLRRAEGKWHVQTWITPVITAISRACREQPAFVQEIGRAQQPVSGIFFFFQNHSMSTRCVGYAVSEGLWVFMCLQK